MLGSFTSFALDLLFAVISFLLYFAFRFSLSEKPNIFSKRYIVVVQTPLFRLFRAMKKSNHKAFESCRGGTFILKIILQGKINNNNFSFPISLNHPFNHFEVELASKMSWTKAYKGLTFRVLKDTFSQTKNI